MTSRKATQEEQAHAVEMLQRLISRDSLVFTRTTYGRGETDHVQVFVIVPEPDGRPAIRDVSYYVARAAGRKVTDRGIAYGGCQYSKALEAADDCWRATFGESIDQARTWRELR